MENVLEQGIEAGKRGCEDADVDFDLRPDWNPGPAPETMLVTVNNAHDMQGLPAVIIVLPALSRFDWSASHDNFT